MNRIFISVLLALSLAAPAVASGPKMSISGGIASAASTFSGAGGELTGGAYSINSATGASTWTGHMGMAGGSLTTTKGLTGLQPTSIYYSGAGSTIIYTPTDENITTDNNRTQSLWTWNSSQDATKMESALVINATSATGFANTYANGKAYVLNSLIDVNGNLYKVTTAGTSASSGTGPTGTGSSISDGSMVVAYQCSDVCNGKVPFFISYIANAGTGHAWGGTIDTILGPGYNGNFSNTMELDGTNNSGAAQPNSNILLISGLAGSNPITNGISISSPSGSSPMLVDALAFGGAHLASEADVRSFSGSPYHTLDTGTHNYGLYLNGTYASQAIFAGGSSSNSDGTGTDQGQIMVSPTSGANRLQLGYVFQSGVKEYARVQASNTTGPAALVLNPAGGMVVAGGNGGTGTLQLSPTTFSKLPTCNASNAGAMAYITDASASVTTWHQSVTAGSGSNKTFVQCQGSGWLSF